MSVAPQLPKATISAAAVAIAGVLVPAVAEAAEGGLLAGGQPLTVLLLLAALSLLPFALIMLTSYVKIAVVLQFLRFALGTPQIPPTMVVTGLALVLTAYVMAPTGTRVYEAVRPALQQERGGGETGLLSAAGAEVLLSAAGRAKEPVREFLIRHSKAGERALFRDLARRMRPKELRSAVDEKDLLVVIPAFVVGQLTAAFLIGFLIFVPFLIIDMVVANILLALGMHMLSPTTISLPFKLLLFVLVDGWYLLTQGLVLSYV
jgi:type III secretion protein R